MTLCPRIMELLRKEGLDDILVLVGGIVPDDDVEHLTKAGIDRIFGPGTPTDRIIAYVRENVREIPQL
jgi:methylmalonyl-CoA mutase C-terminal domain/subunit